MKNNMIKNQFAVMDMSKLYCLTDSQNKLYLNAIARYI